MSVSPAVIDTLTGAQVEVAVTAIIRTSTGIAVRDQLTTFRSDPALGAFEPDSALSDAFGTAVSRYLVTVPHDTTRVLILVGDGLQLVAQRTVTVIGR